MEREVQGYLTEVGILRGQLRDAVKGLSDEGANWQPLSHDTNSIYALFAHFIGVDSYWIRRMIAGERVKRDRDAEFQATGRFADVLEHWEKSNQETDAILEKLSQAQLNETRPVPGRPEWGSVSGQWIILHVLSHYAMHLGHIQLTRQMWDERALK